MREIVYKDWSTTDLLHFPNVEPTLEKEKLKQKEQYKVLRRESYERLLQDTEKRLQKLDIEMNLERLLQQDQKYIGLCRRKPYMTSFFSKIIMNRILHDAHLLMKYEKDEEFQEHFKARVAKTIQSYFPSNGKICDRHYRHEQRFDDFRYAKSTSFDGVKIEVDEERMRDEKARKLLPPIGVAKQHTAGAANEKLRDESDQFDDSESEDEIVSSKTRQNGVGSTVLKPKSQIANSKSFKLPKI